MFRINWVELNNFRSYKGLHRWVLGYETGLFKITGFSNDNARLAENGAGKSSLLDAISWCLYGKTTRGLRSTDVINDDSSSCSVCVNLDVDNENLTIKTTQNPNSLTVNDRVIDRESLVKRLRLNYESFLYSVIIPQFGDQFLELTPSLKLNLFSQILGLDYWLEKSNKASEQAKEIDTKKSNLEKIVSGLKGSAETMKSTIESLRQKAAEWANKQKGQWMALQKLNMEYHQKIHAYELEIKKLDADLQELSLTINKLESEIVQYNIEIRGLDEELASANEEVNLLQYKISNLQSIKSRLNDLGAICPTCNQEVDKDHLVLELRNTEKELTKLRHEKTAYDAAIDEIKKDRSNIKLEMSGTVIQLNNVKSKESDAKGNKIQLLNEIRYLSRKINETDTEIGQLKTQRNEFYELINSEESELDTLSNKVSEKEGEIALLNEKYTAISFWVSGFRQVRLLIVEETLRTLEIEINNCFEQLGLVNWTIEFDVERETKSGGISKGFNTFITNDKGHKTRIEKMSGGEGERAIQAATFGLANLIMERSGLICKTEFYDELSQHLSDAGVDDMLASLRDRAKTQVKQIWIIDHRSTAFADFDGQLMVIKDTAGSRIEQ